MAQQATIFVLLLVFVGAIFIHYMLTNIEPFKGKKRSAKKGLGKKSSGKKRSGKKSPGKKSSGKKRSGKKSPGKKGSGKKRSGKKSAGKKGSGKKGSGKKGSGKKGSGKKQLRGMNAAHSGMKFSDVVGSLLSPSLPDSRDLKDKLHAAVEQSVDNTISSSSNCTKPTDTTGCVRPRPTGGHNPSGACASTNKTIATDAMPYGVDMNDYVKKDNIPCYGCNL